MGQSRKAQFIAIAVFAAAGLAMYAGQQQGNIFAPTSAPSNHNFAATGPTLIQSATNEPALAPSPYARTDEVIQRASEAIRQSPNAVEGYTTLVTGYLRKFRETGDAGYLGRAEAACDKARQLAPNDYQALSLLPCVYDMQHRFAEAIPLAEQAISIDPDDAFNFGTLGDSLTENGDYDGAVKAINQMVKLHPDSWSYARVARLRELYGDMDGAVESMRMSVQASIDSDDEQRAWCHVQLGNLYFNQGRLEEAEPEYAAALEAFSTYSFGLTSMARLRAAQGKFDEAISLYRKSLDIAPRQETVVFLGDLLLHLKKQQEAADVFELMDAIDRIMRANHVLPTYVLVLYWADHDFKLDQTLKEAERCATERDDIKTLDALAWARYKTGRYDDALAASNRSLRLNTRDAMLYFHLGMIQLKLGHQSEAAAALKQAMKINPYFDVRHAPEAQAALDALNNKP